MLLYKIEKNGDIGFYDSDTHSILDEDGNIPKSYIEINAETRDLLLAKNYSGLGEIRMLKNGELGIIVKQDIPNNLVTPEYSYEDEKWIESATQEEINIEIDRLVVEYMDMETERLKRVQFDMPVSASLSKKIEDNIIRRIALQKPQTKEV